MSTLWIDIESYSDVDLLKYGVYRYAESLNFEILMAAWSLGGPTQIAIGEDEVARIPGLFDPNVLKVAHNAQFERVCFTTLARRQHECGPDDFLDPEQYEDTAALAAIAGLPRALADLAKALGAEDKDEAGTALINWFCKPDRTGKRRRPEDHPEKWAQFVAYCIQDVDTLKDVHRLLPDWPSDYERRVFMADQRINDRGIKIDREMAVACITADEQGRAQAGEEMKELLGIDNPGSVPQITAALAKTGLKLPSLRAEGVEKLLASGELTPQQTRALELRQLTALVAARKYSSALGSCNSDGRLRGQFRYFGAHTGRWSSRGVQIQNLPRIALEQTEEHILDLLLGFNPGPEVLKALVRALFVGPFTVVDYSAIEARGLAWAAGEEWVLQAFRDKRDIYVETATRMSTPARPMTRQHGKVAVLALGYQGGKDALRNMGAVGTDEELNLLRDLYREANPRVKRLWYSMERAFVEGGTAGRFRVEKVNRGKDRNIVLPSGRRLRYRGVRVVGSGRDQRILFNDPKGHVADTYGGRLVENGVQALCRDILAQALVSLDSAGYPVVGHVHDEVIVDGEAPVDEIAQVMCRMPGWARGLPLAAEGFVTQRYRKG